MDALAAFLDGPRARAAFLMKVVLEPPWSMRIEDDAPLAVVAVTHGAAWLVHGSRADPVELVAGDVVIVRGPDPYVVAHRPDAEPTIVIDAGRELPHARRAEPDRRPWTSACAPGETAPTAAT